jgi:hypothetical protein
MLLQLWYVTSSSSVVFPAVEFPRNAGLKYSCTRSTLSVSGDPSMASTSSPMSSLESAYAVHLALVVSSV